MMPPWKPLSLRMPESEAGPDPRFTRSPFRFGFIRRPRSVLFAWRTRVELALHAPLMNGSVKKMPSMSTHRRRRQVTIQHPPRLF